MVHYPIYLHRSPEARRFKCPSHLLENSLFYKYCRQNFKKSVETWHGWEIMQTFGISRMVSMGKVGKLNCSVIHPLCLQYTLNLQDIHYTVKIYSMLRNICTVDIYNILCKICTLLYKISNIHYVVQNKYHVVQ